MICTYHTSIIDSKIATIIAKKITGYGDFSVVLSFSVFTDGFGGWTEDFGSSKV